MSHETTVTKCSTITRSSHFIDSIRNERNEIRQDVISSSNPSFISFLEVFWRVVIHWWRLAGLFWSFANKFHSERISFDNNSHWKNPSEEIVEKLDEWRNSSLFKDCSKEKFDSLFDSNSTRINWVNLFFSTFLLDRFFSLKTTLERDICLMSDEQYHNLFTILMNSFTDEEFLQIVKTKEKKTFLFLEFIFRFFSFNSIK